MRKQIISMSAIAAASIALPGVAQAQEYGGNFGGPYVGAIIGHEDVGSSSDIDDDELFDPEIDFRGDDQDMMYGVLIGYDIVQSGGVFGIEAEYTDSGVGSNFTDLVTTGDTAQYNAGRDLYIGARAGVTFGDRALVYVKGGYTNAKFGVDYDDGAGTTFDVSETVDGFRAGAGAEFAITPMIHLRGEYRYSEYSALEYDVLSPQLDFKRDQYVASVVAKF